MATMSDETFFPCDRCGEEVCDAPNSTCLECAAEEEDERQEV
jgi:ribosomal protein L37E